MRSLTRQATYTAATTCIVAAAIAAPAHAAPVTNGSFEQPGFSGGTVRTLPPGDTSVTGWQVTGGSVDWRRPGFLDDSAPDGEYFLELAETDAGVQQTITTVPGKDYTLLFESGPPEGCDLADVAVSIDGGAPRNLGGFSSWSTRIHFFRADADGSTAVRIFKPAGNPAGCDPQIDDVRVDGSGPTTGLVEARATSRATRQVFTSQTLAAGSTNRVVIDGSHSSWDRTLMAPDGQRARGWAVCGTPDPTTVFTTGVPEGRVGEDAAFLFALPQPGRSCNPKLAAKLPSKQSALEFSQDGGATWAPAPRPDGDPAMPYTGISDYRSYTYTVIGTGQPLKVRIADRSPADNRGRYGVEVYDQSETATD